MPGEARGTELGYVKRLRLRDWIQQTKGKLERKWHESLLTSAQQKKRQFVTNCDTANSHQTEGKK